MLAALALGLASCAPPRDPDTLVVLVEKAPGNLDPRLGSDQASARAHELIYRGLFRIADDLSPQGDLVRSHAAPDATTYVLTLRDGIRFSDGRSLTSADVRYTLLSIQQGTSHRKADLEKLVAVETPDAATVVLRLAEPSASFLGNLTFGIVPDGLADANAAPVGAGPYRVAARRGTRWLDLERWGERPAGSFPRIRLLAVADEMARGLNIRKGSVDVVVNDLAPETFRSLAHDRRFRAVVSPGANYAYLMMNCRSGPLAEPRVRRAIAMAIDRREMIEAIVVGLARPATGLLPPESWAYVAPEEDPPFDPEGARRLLDEAGHRDPDGAGPVPRLRLSYKSSALVSSRAQAAVVQDYLARIGIDVAIQSYEWSTYYDDVKKGNFQLASLVWVGVADPDGLRARFHSAMAPPRGVNRGRYGNPELDRILDAAERELDRAARARLYAEAQRILARDAPYVSLWYKHNYALVRRGVGGLRLGPFASFDALADVRREATP